MKLLKFAGLATAATAVGWAIGSLVFVVYLARQFEQADLDDERGGFDPAQVAERILQRGQYEP